MAIIIRRALPSDSPSLSEICLLTGDAGKSAEPLHSAGNRHLLASVYALPYVHPALTLHTGGHVLFDTESQAIVGYVLYATDTRAFEAAAEERYWPALRATHPLPLAAGNSNEFVQPNTLDDVSWPVALTEADKRIIRLFHTTASEFPANEAALAFSPAHLHIDILPIAQVSGWYQVHILVF
jgi:hypothetical protein